MNELRRDGLSVQRWNLLHPGEKQKQAYVAECLAKQAGPIVAATDYMKIYADQLRQFLPGKKFVSLGTDGFGVSETREGLRDRFEVDRRYICLAALTALAEEGQIPMEKVVAAMKKYDIDAEKIDPVTL
jgi:pyruvate dehydrogenase E1 component